MNNRMDRVVATRVRDDIAKRLDALAKREMRTVGAMARILIKEALDARAEAEDPRTLREIYKELER